MARYDTLVMCSGGLDSVVMLHELLHHGQTCRMVYGNFGKRSTAQEIATVRRLSMSLGVPLDIIEVAGLAQLQRAYDSPSRFDNEELDVGGHMSTSRCNRGMRDDEAFITGIHCILSICSYAAHLTDAGSVALAVTKDQALQFPNIGKAFCAWEECVALFNPGVSLKVLTPTIDRTKSDLVALGANLGVRLEETWSCVVSTTQEHCGSCNQCQSRKHAFTSAGIADPTAYLS